VVEDIVSDDKSLERFEDLISVDTFTKFWGYSDEILGVQKSDVIQTRYIITETLYPIKSELKSCKTWHFIWSKNIKPSLRYS
jgi:hypothetical protein